MRYPIIYALGFFSLSPLAHGQGFENLLLKSHSIVSPSQHYQVKGMRIEGLASSTSGSYKNKTSGESANPTGYEISFGIAQGLVNDQLVVAAEFDSSGSSIKIENSTSSDTLTKVKPVIAFNITPMVSVGAAIHLMSKETKITGLDPVTSNFNVLTFGATAHLNDWETSLAVTTENKDDTKRPANSPQTVALHGRYRFNPALGLGGVFRQRDFARLAPPRSTAEIESQYSLILESAFSDSTTAEVAFISTSTSTGIDGDAATTLDLKGFYKISQTLQLGASLASLSSSSDATDIQLNKVTLFSTIRF